MSYEIFNEDCLEGMKRLANGSVGAVITDLPFAITDCDWDKAIDLERFWREVNRVLAPCSSALLFASSRFTFELYASNPEQFRYRWIWAKNSAADFINAKNKPQTSFEDIMVFSNGVVAHKGKSARRMKYFPQGLRPYTQGERVNYSKKKQDYATRQASEDSTYRMWNTVPPPCTWCRDGRISEKASGRFR